ncbi:hypothetical protein HDU85_007252 [Gaertneriomyces sp. JEL0708]|nr:hypothetical protein HDU85_007252 [Gaertneriomyces sp. JEL0708]
MSEVAVPRNWLATSNTFARSYSDPRGEGVTIYSPVGQSEYTTKARTLTPIRIKCDSNQVSFILQKLVLSWDLSIYKTDGTSFPAGGGVKNTALGADAIIQTLVIKAGGETVVNIPNYNAYLADVYKNLPTSTKALLTKMSGYNRTDLFSSTSTVTVNHHPLVGFCHPTNDSFFHVWALPDQALEIQITLADPAAFFVGASGQPAEVRISNIRCLVPFITPPPSFVINTTRAISEGKSVFYDYVRSTQVENASSGSNLNTYMLHMSGIRSLQGISCMYIDGNAVQDPTKDNNLSYSSHGLREWWIRMGALTIPSGITGFTHSPTDMTTLLVTHLSDNNFDQIGAMDLNYNYDTQLFNFGYSFQSKDEGSTSALSMTGTDGIMRITTRHEGSVPVTVRLLSTLHENVTLAVGSAVTVV